MLKQRIITALILAGIFFTTLFSSSHWPWLVFVSVMVIQAWREWIKLSKMSMSKPVVWLATALLLAGAYALTVSAYSWIAVLGSVVLWLFLIVSTLRSNVNFNSLLWLPTVKLFLGVWILALTWWALIWLRAQTDGQWWLVGFLLIMFLADSGAYFTGKRFGKRKLAAHVSPGKTVEGLIGGVVAISIYAIIAILSLQMYSNSVLLFVGAIIIALVSVGGDLFESVLKRQAGLKDSSNILPGHGGVLDRVDSLLAALPFMLLVYAWQSGLSLGLN